MSKEPESYDDVNARMSASMGPRASITSVAGSIGNQGANSAEEAAEMAAVQRAKRELASGARETRLRAESARDWKERWGVTFRSEPPDRLQFLYDDETGEIVIRVIDPPEEDAVVGGADPAGFACALRPQQERPEGYSEAEGSTKGWVTWGHVNSAVFGNIAESYSLAAGKKIYAKVTTNGSIPLKVLSAEIDATTSTREDTGGTATTPPTTAYYLLGQVIGAGTVASPFAVIPSGCGNLQLSAVAIGYECTLATSGDPGATPPVPASPGGIKTNYQLRWDRVA